MRRFVLSPKWWVGHVLVALVATVFVALGVWQWDRSQSATGDFQNLGYAMQWPLFAVFVALAWWRVLRLESRRAPLPTPPPVAPPSRPLPGSRDKEEDETDDELAAYNAYLARLAEADRRR